MKTINHHSPRADQFLALKRPSDKLHELCLKRSDVKLEVNIEGELAAQQAAAKLLARSGRHISSVWTEDGECPDNGKYRIWYMVTVPIGGRNGVRH